MSYLISAMLVVVAVIHLLPLPGVLGNARLNRLYGLSINEPNLVILMRHRAVLFGLLGAFLLFAAFVPDYQVAALIAGYASVLSFLWLAHPAAQCNAQLRRVLVADLVALAALVIGSVARVLQSVSD